jgi:hypothetical protein
VAQAQANTISGQNVTQNPFFDPANAPAVPHFTKDEAEEQRARLEIIAQQQEELVALREQFRNI